MKRHSPGAGFTKLLCAILLACSVSQASADIIDITFTGLARGTRPTVDANNVYSLNQFFEKPFTAEFVFNTDLGVLSNHRLDGGLVSAFLTLDGIIPWGGGAQFFGIWGPSLLLWNDDLSAVVAHVGATYYNLAVSNIFSPSGHSGIFQFGLCPTVVGGPCGYMTSAELTGITGLPLAVPSSIVGAGLPGLLAALGGMWMLARRRRA